MDVSGLAVWQLSLLLFPLYLAAIAIGVFFLLRQTPQGDPEKTPDGGKPPFLPLLVPIIVIRAQADVMMAINLRLSY